ncbi:hypothetical protein FBULB1_7790 [Fusarium bulbicola]|nr:hypothetical protein FBULB1_7790 [Fusarium bulbicola]
MHSFKIILISLVPVLAMPATSPLDIHDEESFDFDRGFLVPANVSIEDYDFTPMVPLSHLKIRDLETWEEPLAPEMGNMTEFDLDTRAPKETRLFFGKAQHLHMAGGGRRKDAWLRISVRGEYFGRHTRGYMASAVQKPVTPKTAKPAMRYYLPTNPNFQAQSCKMSKFSNYIKMRKNFGDTIHMEIEVSLKTSNTHCFTPNLLKEVAGALGGIGGSFFGTFVTAMIGC